MKVKPTEQQEIDQDIDENQFAFEVNSEEPLVFIKSISNQYLVTIGFQEPYYVWKNLTDLTSLEYKLDNDTIVSNL